MPYLAYCYFCPSKQATRPNSLLDSEMANYICTSIKSVQWPVAKSISLKHYSAVYSYCINTLFVLFVQVKFCR
jgi:hypothetical protein